MSATLADDVRQIIADVDAERERSQQAALGISGIGACRREAAYRLSNTPYTDTSIGHPAAMLGTWLHASLLPELVARLGGDWEMEVPVIFDGIPGSIDLCRPGDVLDLKTVGDWSWTNVKRHGMRKKDRWQTTGYAAARRAEGHRVDWITVVYLNRETGEVDAYTEPFDETVLTDMRDWLTEVNGYVAEGPENAPRDERGPGLSIVCDGCPFRSGCWPNAQKTVLDEAGAAGIEPMLALYDEAATREKDAKKDKDFARAALDGLAPNVYGHYKLSWRSTGERINTKAVEQILTDNGFPIPRNPAGTAISVKPV